MTRALDVVRQERARLEQRIAELEDSLERETADWCHIDDNHLRKITELEAENAKLRGQQPGNDVLFAVTMLAMMHDGSEHSRLIAAWLDNIDPVDSMADYRGILPYDPDGPSSEERVRRVRGDDGEAESETPDAAT